MNNNKLCCLHVTTLGKGKIYCDEPATEYFKCPHNFVAIPLCPSHNMQLKAECLEKHGEAKPNADKFDNREKQFMWTLIKRKLEHEVFLESTRQKVYRV